MSLLTKVRSSLNRNPNTFGLRLSRVHHSLFDILRYMTAERIMEISDKIVSIFGGQGHEGPTHNHKLDFVNIVPDPS